MTAGTAAGWRSTSLSLTRPGKAVFRTERAGAHQDQGTSERPRSDGRRQSDPARGEAAVFAEAYAGSESSPPRHAWARAMTTSSDNSATTTDQQERDPRPDRSRQVEGVDSDGARVCVRLQARSWRRARMNRLMGRTACRRERVNATGRRSPVDGLCSESGRTPRSRVRNNTASST